VVSASAASLRSGFPGRRYLSLTELHAAVRCRAERSRTRTVESAAIRVEANRHNSERLTLTLPGEAAPLAPTHWSFGQLASMVGAPPTYLRQLPAPLAAINLQYGLTSNRAEQIKTLEVEDGRVELRAVTSPDYGRIFDQELVAAVQRIAGNGTGDTRWKVPGVLDWSTGVYNPRMDVTKSTTTLYASDRDVFLDRRPQSDRGRQITGRLAGSLFPRLLSLELRGWCQDARDREFLSSSRLPESQSLGRRGFRGDHDPPL
jgi:hypothetical protein